jgi:hypothetical protein
MKKILILLLVVFMIASVAYAAKKVMITKSNVASLKGTWQGVASLGATAQENSPMILEILNDTVPVKAKLTLTNVPNTVAMQFGEQPGKKEGESDDGVITSQGTLFWTGPAKNFFEVTLLDNKKLSVWAMFRGMKIDGTLAMKK